jgi:hypothetical protein|tara:strand:+ start:146 stop:268 length:123 start_codon:yes stop_codon:yes gene_type:complete
MKDEDKIFRLPKWIEVINDLNNEEPKMAPQDEVDEETTSN